MNIYGIRHGYPFADLSFIDAPIKNKFYFHFSGWSVYWREEEDLQKGIKLLKTSHFCLISRSFLYLLLYRVSYFHLFMFASTFRHLPIALQCFKKCWDEKSKWLMTSLQFLAHQPIPLKNNPMHKAAFSPMNTMKGQSAKRINQSPTDKPTRPLAF